MKLYEMSLVCARLPGGFSTAAGVIQRDVRAMWQRCLIATFSSSHRSLACAAPHMSQTRLPTPWQELRANPSTYKGENWRNLFVLFKLRSELPRGPREDHHVGSAGSRAVRNEGRRAVVREPIGPCRSTLVHMCGAVRVPTCIVKLG